MKRTFVFLVALAVLPVILLLLASLLNGQFALADSLAHFRAHYLVLLLFTLVVFALLRTWRHATIVAVSAAVGLWSTFPAWPGFSSLGLELKEGEPGKLKLVQFNTLFKNPKPSEAAQWILKQSPDFVIMQEVSSNTISISDALARDLPFGLVCKFASIGGVALRSRHPIVTQSCREGQGFARAQVAVNGKSMTLASLHLHWPYPFRQWQQIQALEGDFHSMPKPAVLSGDFNAAPWSAAVHHVAEATNTTVVPGLRLTRRVEFAGIGPVPFLPIDHVLLPERADVLTISVGPPIGSDHLPVVAEFVLQ